MTLDRRTPIPSPSPWQGEGSVAALRATVGWEAA